MSRAAGFPIFQVQQTERHMKTHHNMDIDADIDTGWWCCTAGSPLRPNWSSEAAAEMAFYNGTGAIYSHSTAFMTLPWVTKQQCLKWRKFYRALKNVLFVYELTYFRSKILQQSSRVEAMSV